MFKMRRFNFFKICFWLLLVVIFQISSVNAQMPRRGGNQVAITGWTDDTHYLIRTFDQDKNLITQSVNIKTGKGVTIPSVKSERDQLYESLPEGIKASMGDAISDDMKSIVIVQDNDLYFFKIGDK